MRSRPSSMNRVFEASTACVRCLWGGGEEERQIKDLDHCLSRSKSTKIVLFILVLWLSLDHEVEGRNLHKLHFQVSISTSYPGQPTEGIHTAMGTNILESGFRFCCHCGLFPLPYTPIATSISPSAHTP